MCSQGKGVDIRSINLDHLVGQRVGNCVIIKEIGRGSMGIVYTAYQVSLKRPVAVKILPKAIIRDPVAMARFRQEAEAAAILSHPNIIQIYEIGETEEYLYMIIQLVRGAGLSTVMERRRKHVIPSKRLLPLRVSFNLILQVLDGLGYAHEEGIVHRDVKPANILIEARTSRAIITDFGIARELRGEDLDHGKVLGTPLYMAPEQARGESVDGRADIYSVGVILFEMAAGDLPIHHEPLERLRIRKLTEPLGLFSKRPSEAHPRIGPELEALILKAIAFHPEDRYPTCFDMAKDIKALDRVFPSKSL